MQSFKTKAHVCVDRDLFIHFNKEQINTVLPEFLYLFFLHLTHSDLLYDVCEARLSMGGNNLSTAL